MMEYKKFISHVKAQGFTWAKLYNSSGDLFAMFPESKKGNSSTTEVLIAGFDKVKSGFGGQYRVTCKRFGSDKEENSCSFDVIFEDVVNDAAIKPDSITTPYKQLDIKVMAKEIQENVIAAQIKRESAIELERLKEENSYLKEPAGILTEVIRMVGEKAQAKGYTISTRSGVKLQGSEGATDENSETTNQPRYDLLEPDKPKETDDLKEALTNFRSVGVTDNYLLQLSERVKAKPTLVDTVSNLLNIKI